MHDFIYFIRYNNFDKKKTVQLNRPKILDIKKRVLELVS
jgi:hypothetical protein